MEVLEYKCKSFELVGVERIVDIASGEIYQE